MVSELLVLQGGKVVGCERNGHSAIYCDDCEISDSAMCPALSKFTSSGPNIKCTVEDGCGIGVNVPSKYEIIAKEVAKLVEIKQQQYGHSFNDAHKILEVFYPEGIQPKDYQDLLTVVRVIDKLFRITRGDQGDESAWKDINGYSLLSLVRDAEK